jgi:cell division septum initiation protein DivIVA
MTAAREQVYLEVVEGWLRDNRSIIFTEGAVDDLCDRVAAKMELLRKEIERLRQRVDVLEGMLGEMNIAVPEW